MHHSALLPQVLSMNQVVQRDRHLGAIFLGVLVVFAIAAATAGSLMAKRENGGF
jgi:hypothetical protein